MNAFNEGLAAAFKGLGLDACPYIPFDDKEWEDWCEGWRLGQG